MSLALLAGPALAQDLVVNEILYDGAGSDVGMFTEIKGPGGLSLDGYKLFGVNGNGGAVYAAVSLDGLSIPADGYFVIAQDASVVEADAINSLVDWQNGPDQVALVLITGGEADTVTVDSICYGGSVDLNCEGGNPGPDVPSASSIARCPDGQDTDDNGADTIGDPTPTPGVANDADCLPPPPLELSVCEVMELDADGFPTNFGESVHLTEPVILLHDSDVYATGRFDSAVMGTASGCCTYLFDFNIVAVYPEGTTFDVTGVVDFFNGKVEITSLDLVVLGSDVLPVPTAVTTGELATNGEAYESCLISLKCVNIVDGVWPAEGSDSNLDVDDGTGPVEFRVDKDTNIDGSPIPDQPFSAIGIGGQFDSSAPYDSFYQFLPRYLSDINDEDAECHPTATETTSWGRLKSTYKDK
jgi:hypothetical protein